MLIYRSLLDWGHTLKMLFHQCQTKLVTHWFLSHDELFHLLHLGDVVFVGFELSLADPFVDAHQGLSGDILPVIHAWHRAQSYATIITQ